MHFFKAGRMVMVGELIAGLPAILQCLRLRAGISAAEASGILAVTATNRQLSILRLDFASDASGATAALIRRPSGSKGWPPPMLPVGYRIAA